MVAGTLGGSSVVAGAVNGDDVVAALAEVVVVAVVEGVAVDVVAADDVLAHAPSSGIRPARAKATIRADPV